MASGAAYVAGDATRLKRESTDHRARRSLSRVTERVGARAVAADLASLQTMLNWATSHTTVRNEPLLDRSPLRGVKLPGLGPATVRLAEVRRGV